MSLQTRSRRLAAAALSAVLLYLSGEPVAWAPVAWVALVPLFMAVFSERRPAWGFLYGLVAGVAYFGAHLSWIFLFGALAWTALALTLATYAGAATALATAVRRLPLAPVFAAGAWVGAELIRNRWPFGGFEWGTLGATQGPIPGVRWLAGTIGASGLSFLAAFVAAVVADRLVNGAWARPSMVAVAASVVLFGVVDLATYGDPPPGRPFEVAAIQGNAPRPVTATQERDIFESHLALTKRVLQQSRPDVVVWPESAVGHTVGPRAQQSVAALAREHGVPFLVGRYEADHSARAFLNLVDHYDASGVLTDVYQKQHPVPFGEHVPLGFLRGRVSALDQVPYDMVPGRGPEVFRIDGVTVATPICFESAFARDVRAFARRGAEVHIVVTNDASFERSSAASQHLAHTRMRALELRQWVVQAAISGHSAVLGPDGSVSHRTRLFEPETIVAQVRARPASSLYARTGDLFAGAFAAGSMLALALWWFAGTPALHRRGGRNAVASDSCVSPSAPTNELPRPTP